MTTTTPRRWYGQDQFGDPPPPEGTPGIELVGGPLDGLWMVLIGNGPRHYPDGVALYAGNGAYPDGRSHYVHADPPDGRLHWEGDSA
ncbi:hypothetical protein [Embleya sp. NPDC059237]|uniref:hypothetical protein n=1 Tax=Embleya sp. NPDC059237 TaxID=3346784 RepID=UPI003684FBCF